ncbi:hypothetical protein QEZ47_05340 [Aminobacter anthyllidis]|jgi:hypothetical protein|uniref:Uncharacterized protein n=2 Tax=Aminobacter TaxID=31988 RepID=A0AAC8YT00_AMIAI|nr:MULTISPECIES: DUF6746 family protein [Aminobacter]AMS43923.1 hypothetical protein AA2016_5015 [Aminobacter aminovorans]MBB3705690.1 hypothetical protein [Aminobacter aminovorans]MBB6464975.1 hypothetical protein [Aminobacter lissarensis]MDH4984977.1 hypothetical protein [Aminobacter anthyllidis]MRX36692.1 hypothetical protein [Aminobacter sp. MDW-2]
MTAWVQKLTLGSGISAAILLAAAVGLPTAGTMGQPAKHYAVEIPRTVEEASAMMRRALSKVEQALATDDYASIHKASYELEAAASRIAGRPNDQSETLVHTVEILHRASEATDREVLQATFPQLKEAVARAALLPRPAPVGKGGR